MNISPDRIIFGNGGSEFIALLPGILNIDRVLIPVPSYSEYKRQPDGIETILIPLMEQSDFNLDISNLQKQIDSTEGKKLVFLGQPNNPTGKSIPIEIITVLADRNRDVIFSIDESFADFIPEYKSIALKNIPNIVVIKSLTKFYGIPGLRLGMCIGSPDIIKAIKKYQIPWSVNTLAMKIGEKLFSDKYFFNNSIRATIDLKKQLIKDLSKFSWLKIYPGEANFILLQIIDQHIEFEHLDSYIRENGLIIRNCCNFDGLNKSFFRIAVKNSSENRLLIDCLDSFSSKLFLKPELETKFSGNIKKPNRKALSLMIQGTASNAGKSILVAGICRILSQDGYNVAPFKAQNMSNNSAVTIGGKEIGRAQALQAKACNLTPNERMNPVLLKPSSERRSQVIINGIVKGNMTVKNWKDFKIQIRQEVEKSYDSLASEYEVIVLEGAGSPGEINLKENDIVNMGMARYSNSPVLITGDIDRGGVYASLIGTMDVFDEWERNLVKGFIINRFRGDPLLLKSAHDFLYEYTGRQVLGIVPYIQNLNLPEEDSVSLKDGSYFSAPKNNCPLKIALIDLPYISNFTDIDPLRMEADVEIVLINNVNDLDTTFSAVIIPGSKNTTADLQWLKGNGFYPKLTKMSTQGIIIVGICGGFQILGKSITDKLQVESLISDNNNAISGLGMLEIDTTFHSDKLLKQRESFHIPSGCKVKGYEIHHGVSSLTRGKRIIASGNDLLGASSENGDIWGTYLHGIFDSDKFRLWFLNSLRIKQGLPTSDSPSYIYDIDKSLNRLADILRENLDINQLKSIIGL